MPQNANLTPVILPMKLKFGEKPTTEFKNSIDAVGVKMIEHTGRWDALNVAWQMAKSTWADSCKEISSEYCSERELSNNISEIFLGRSLPSPMESIGFTFMFYGLDNPTMTHMIRHRTFTIASQCTGDRDLRCDSALIPESIENSPEFIEEWKKCILRSKELYAKIVDSKKVSMMDARIILPKCLESFLIVKSNLKDLAGFVMQRKDHQIQTFQDNIIAALVVKEVLSVFPESHVLFDLRKPDYHYIKTFRVKDDSENFVAKGTNLYWPTPNNDLFEYHPNDTIYQNVRDNIRGTNCTPSESKFMKRWNSILGDIDNIIENFKYLKLQK